MNNYQRFMDRCKSINDIELSIYIQMVCKCLIMSDYNYTVIEAIKTVLNNIDYIETFYKNKESVYNCMIELGYCCG